MKKTIFSLFVFSFICNVQTVKANFGFGPCCPPSLCGIIPCDSACAGAAINQMGVSVTSAINTLNSAYNDQTSAMQDAVNSLTNVGTAVSDVLTNQTSNINSGLSASTSKIELAYTSSSKSLERTADFNVQTFVNAIGEIEVARAATGNRLSFGDLAQPLSGLNGANQAAAIKKLYVQTQQIGAVTTSEFMGFLNDVNQTNSSAGSNFHILRSTKLLDSFSRLSYALTSTTIEQADFEQLQKVLGLATSSQPLPKAILPNDLNYELAKRRYISMLAISYQSLFLASSSKMGLDDGVWADNYQDLEGNSDGKVSLSAFYHAETEGRLANSEWWGSVKRLNDSGLRRENIYEKALSLKLKSSLAELSESKNRISAIFLSKKMDEKKINLKRLQNQL